MVMTSPVIDGAAEGNSVDGARLGMAEGIAVGTEVTNTASLSTSHSLLVIFSNASIDTLTLSVLVASIINCTSAVTPNSGATVTSNNYHFSCCVDIFSRIKITLLNHINFLMNVVCK